MTLKLRIALRDWDYITPLILKDVRSDRVSLEIERVGTLIGDLGKSETFDAAEQSFSRYTQIIHDGRDDIVGIPAFIMRGFRHRCIITTRKSPLKSLADLKGKNIGVTGWRDSGNSWTRAALRREGVEIEDARWFAGRLTAEHPITDRLDGFGRPGLIEACPDERPMTELLEDGFLDAVFTPFMPSGFFEGTSPFRQVVEDFVAAETRYFRDVGYVPGMHLIAVKADIIDANPWLPEELSRMIEESGRMWTAKRRKYADTTPFMLDELRRSAMALPDDWQENGLAANRTMIADFARELYEQKILPRLLSPEDLFPRFT
ncbi:nitrate ABC transporter substrate-binding protein [uncultured Martelella sp.]|uniref:nitrate ABC transporter substrate-binding protein n=1 Tax=uncultured Martelella sp. TaxID=392331 RepID=UPI0029C910E1|nr:nitrate ABC transporter substrate-binding protein [uncultured Martelella sp.]